MPTPEIEEFARILVRQVRDEAVRGCDALLLPVARSPKALRWKALDATESDVRVVIPDVVDEMVFRMLLAIDAGQLRLKFVSSTGREVDLTDEGMGELAGWYAGHGWREAYCEERFTDYLADPGTASEGDGGPKGARSPGANRTTRPGSKKPRR